MAGALLVVAVLAAASTPGTVRAEQHDEPVPICGTQDGVIEGVPDTVEAVPSPDPDARVRVATYNLLTLEADETGTLDARLPLIADAIAAASVDAVGVQEAERMTSRGFVIQRLAELLAERTGDTWRWCWFKANPHLPGSPDSEPGGGTPADAALVAGAGARVGEAQWWEGVGVLSRLPVVAAGAHRLPGRGDEPEACEDPECALVASFESRVVVRARIATSGGQLDVFSTHLSHTITPRSEETRVTQVSSALAYVEERASADTLPTVLVGDFNTEHGSPAYQPVVAAGFLDTFQAANPGVDGLTSGQEVDADAPTVTARIDYVFVREGQCPVEILASEVFGNQPSPHNGGMLWPSDHYAVVTELAIPGDCPPPGEPAPEPVDEAAPPDTLPATGGGAAFGSAALVLWLGALALLRRTR